MLFLASVPDAWTIGFGIFVVLFDALVGYYIFQLGAAQRRFERLEDERDKALDRHKSELSDANAQLHMVTSKLVDERFRAMTHELNGHVNGFGLALDDMKRRIAGGEEDFEKLGDRNQQLELAMSRQIDLLKDWIRENTASKNDVDKHQESMTRQLGQVAERVTEMGMELANLKGRKERA